MARLLRASALALVLLSISAPSFAATYVYVHSRGTSQVFGFELAKDGTLSALPGSPFATGAGVGGCGGYCQTMAYSKRGKALIAGGVDAISSLVVAKDGSLSQATGSPLAITGDFLGTGVAQSGKYVYVNEFDAGEVHGFEVGKGGELTAISGSPWSTGGTGPDGLSTAKKVVVSVNEDSDNIASFLIGKGGVLSAAPGSPVTPSGVSFIYNVDVEPKGKFAYSGDCGLAQVHGFAIDKKTAALTQLSGSPFASGFTVCGGLAPTKKGAIAIEQGDDVQVFAREKDGALSNPGTPVLTNGSDSHALTKNEKVLVLADDGADVLQTFAFDRKTGSITPIDSEAITGAAGANQTVVVQR